MDPKRLIPDAPGLIHLYEQLPEQQRMLTDVLRQLVREKLPPYCRETISRNVPFFKGHKGICIIWPAAIPRGGIHEGVLLGFWQGYRLRDEDHYLEHGSNRKIFYRIFRQVEEIDLHAIGKLVQEAVQLDRQSPEKKLAPGGKNLTAPL